MRVMSVGERGGSSSLALAICDRLPCILAEVHTKLDPGALELLVDIASWRVRPVVYVAIGDQHGAVLAGIEAAGLQHFLRMYDTVGHALAADQAGMRT